MKKILSVAAVVAAASLQAGVSPAPKVAEGSTLAMVMDVKAAMANPVQREYYDYCIGVYERNADMKALLEVFRACGLDSADVKWATFALGKLTRPADDAASFKLPDITATIVSQKPVTLAPIEALVKKFVPAVVLEEIKKDSVIAEKTIAGEKVTTIGPKEPLPVDLVFCYGVVQGKALVMALTEGAFERQAMLVKSPKVPSDARFAAVVKQSPDSAGKMFAPEVGKVVAAMAKPEELAMLGEMPNGSSVASVLTGLGDVSFDLFVKDGAFKYEFSVEFGNETDAAAIAQFAQAGLTAFKGQVAVELEGQTAPDVVLGKKLIDSFEVAQTGKKIAFTASAPIADLKAMVTDESIKEMVDGLKMIKTMLESAAVEETDDEDDEDDEDEDDDEA